MNQIKNRCALWVRVSTDEQDTYNQSLVLQDRAETLGFDVIKTYDVTASAYKNQHEPELVNFLKDARRLNIRHLMVYDLSRLCRQGIEQTFVVLNRIQKIGVQVHSCDDTENNMDPETGEIRISLNAFIYNRESKLISERTKAGLRRVKKEGQILGRPSGSKDKKPRKVGGYYARWNKHIPRHLRPENPM